MLLSRLQTVAVVGACAALVIPVAVARADKGGGGARRPPPKPPAEAYEACAARAAGDACQVTLGDRTIDGECRADPHDDGGALVCMPERPPGPPPEAIEACSGKAAGDACEVAHDGHTLAGTCRSGPDGAGPLACAPARRD